MKVAARHLLHPVPVTSLFICVDFQRMKYFLYKLVAVERIKIYQAKLYPTD